MSLDMFLSLLLPSCTMMFYLVEMLMAYLLSVTSREAMGLE